MELLLEAHIRCRRLLGLYFRYQEPFLATQVVPDATDSAFRMSFPPRKDPLFENRTLLSARCIILNLTGTLSPQFSHTSKYGIGADLWYDGATGALGEIGSRGAIRESDLSHYEKLNFGLHLSYERVVNEVSVLIQMGYVIIRKDYEGAPDRLYQKAGLKWHVWRDVFIGLKFRAQEFQAVFLEPNFGYRRRL